MSGNVDYIERIAQEYGPVVVAYIIENYEPDPEQNMVWTVSMFDGRDLTTPSGTVVQDWHDHEHGGDLQETAKALWEQLRRERGPGRVRGEK